MLTTSLVLCNPVKILPIFKIKLDRFIGDGNITLFNICDIYCCLVLEAVTIIFICLTTFITSKIYLLCSINDVHWNGILTGNRPLDQVRTRCC